MYLSIFNPVFSSLGFEDMLKKVNSLGINSIEIGSGPYPGKDHLDCAELLENSAKIDTFKNLLNKYSVSINAISVHGNPISPDRELAKNSHDDFVNACKLANILGVKTIITFSGCPEGKKGDSTPNWITCAWPEEYGAALNYQWEEKLVPYWKETIKIAEENNVNVAIEMHPGFCVYNPYTMKKLSNLVGSKNLGVNFDPSHLRWQQVDPIVAIKELSDIIYHFHAKDVYMDESNTSKNGVLDTQSYGDIINRSWTFRSVGYGMNESMWKDMMSTLRLVGYNGAISIEHEDALLSIDEGLKKAIGVIEKVILKEDADTPWWF